MVRCFVFRLENTRNIGLALINKILVIDSRVVAHSRIACGDSLHSHNERSLSATGN